METENKNTKLEAQKELLKRIHSEGEGKLIEVNWNEGKTPEQFNDVPVNISGTITAPSLFIAKREGEFYDKTAHALVSKSEGKITLVINEQTVSEKYTISGKIDIGKRFVELGINTDKSYSPTELSKKFRLLRSLFPSRAEHASIVTLLRNFKAKISQEMDKEDDARGGVKVSYKQAVESNIPESFKMLIPLLEGADPVEIEVQVLLEVEQGSSVQCFLESIDGADLIEEAKTTLVVEEVAKIEDKVTVIYY